MLIYETRSLFGGSIFKKNLIFFPINTFAFLVEINFDIICFCQIHQFTI